MKTLEKKVEFYKKETSDRTKEIKLLDYKSSYIEKAHSQKRKDQEWRDKVKDERQIELKKRKERIAQEREATKINVRSSIKRYRNNVSSRARRTKEEK